MKTFLEYLEDKDEMLLDEDITNIISSVFGIATISLAGMWMMRLLIKSTRKTMKLITNKTEAKEIFRELKEKQNIKINKVEAQEDKKEHRTELQDVIKAIQEKDATKVIAEMKLLEKKKIRIKRKVIIEEIIVTHEAPPLHFGNTGNDTYLFIKKVFGIQEAQSLASVVQNELKKRKIDLEL